MLRNFNGSLLLYCGKQEPQTKKHTSAEECQINEGAFILTLFLMGAGSAKLHTLQ